MRVIHDVPAPRELASIPRSFLYRQIYNQVSEEPKRQYLQGQDEPRWPDQSGIISHVTCVLTSSSSSLLARTFCRISSGIVG